MFQIITSWKYTYSIGSIYGLGGTLAPSCHQQYSNTTIITDTLIAIDWNHLVPTPPKHIVDICVSGYIK